MEYSLLIRLPLGLLWVAGAALGLAQWADRRITMNLLVAGQTSLERRREICRRHFLIHPSSTVRIMRQLPQVASGYV